MSLYLVCRICLAFDVRMYTIANSPLQEIYEKLTNLLFQSGDGRPKTVCYICYYQLKKCNHFMQMSVKSDQLLSQLLSTGIELTEKSLNMASDRSCLISWGLDISPMEYITSVVPENKVKVPIKLESMKTELSVLSDIENSELNEDFSSFDNPIHDSSDSEDDIPLQNICKKIIETSNVKKRRAKVKKRDIKISKRKNGVFVDAREIELSKEEQKQQLLQRSKSHNYLNSPYKCELCYKGFVDTNAFENHKEKHDERSGQFDCEICHMKYQTLRLMKTHVVSSHSKQYACNKCSHRSHTANQARDHERWHSGYTYECQLCGLKFRKPTSYLTHTRKRHPTEHICNICGESFVSKHGIVMHKRKVHKKENESDISGPSSKYCSECNIHFVSIEAWTKHVLSSLKHTLTSKTRSSCLVCGLEVPSGTLQAHLQKHDVLKTSKAQKQPKLTLVKVTCDMCGLDFVNRSKLQSHVTRIHLGKKYDKNIVCEVCGKKCTSNATLKYHQRTHSGERPHACQHCPKRFVDTNQLRIHTRTHSGERPYSCLTCGKRFTQKPALNRHFRVHTGAKPYDCQYCSKTFSQSNSLKIHVNTVHLKLPPKKKIQNAESSAENEKLELATQTNDTQS